VTTGTDNPVAAGVENARVTLFERKFRIESARLPGWDYASPGWYFVTICTQGGQCYFGDVTEDRVNLSQIGRIAASELENLPIHYSNIQVEAVVVMPNHVHAIIVIEGRHQYSPGLSVAEQPFRPDDFPHCSPHPGSLAAIVRSYKAGVTRICRLSGFGPFAWQSRFYEHILRSNVSVNAVRDYIQRNPKEWFEDQGNPACNISRPNVL
jgi:REP element-mobilizing transposase RayT